MQRGKKNWRGIIKIFTRLVKTWSLKAIIFETKGNITIPKCIIHFWYIGVYGLDLTRSERPIIIWLFVVGGN